jgi:hypothetical protein
MHPPVFRIQHRLSDWPDCIVDLQCCGGSAGIADKIGYADRWCYATRELAQKALDEWTGQDEPSGWHRHPATGRRRENGDPAREYIAMEQKRFYGAI